MDVGKFIDLVRTATHLYDPADARRRSKVAATCTWQKIAKEMGLEEQVCRDKWHTLRSNYMRERRKLSAKTCGYETKWSHYEQMTFLDNYFRTRPGQSASPAEETQTVVALVLPKIESELTDELILSPEDESLGYHQQDEDFTKRGGEEEVDVGAQGSKRKWTENEAGEVKRNDDDMNSDRMFLLSLLPMVNRLKEVDNIDFRLEVQQILRAKLYPMKSKMFCNSSEYFSSSHYSDS